MTFPRPQPQKIFVFLQSVQFRDADNSWGYGCSVLYRALFFKWISIFITVGGLIAVGLRFYLSWAILFVTGRTYRAVGSFKTVLGIHLTCWAFLNCIGHSFNLLGVCTLLWGVFKLHWAFI